MPTKGQTSKCVVVKKQEYCYNVDILWVGAAITINTSPRPVLCVAKQLCARFSVTKESPAFLVGSYGSVARKAINTCFLRDAAGRWKGGPDFGHVWSKWTI